MAERAVQIVDFRGSYKPILDLNAVKGIVKSKGTEKLPTVVISIGGVPRSGKSFLLNLIVHFLRHIERGGTVDNWETSEEIIQGVHWAQSKTSVTHGIWMWNTPYKIRRQDGSEIAVLMLDCQGTGDSRFSDAKMETQIMFISLEIAQYQLMNIQNYITSTELSNLQLCSDYTNICQDGHDKSQGNTIFNNLVFLVKNYNGSDLCGEDNEIFDDILNEGANQELTKTVSGIKRAFKNINTFTFPHPGPKIDKASVTKQEWRLKDIPGEFLDVVKALCTKVFLYTECLVRGNHTGHDLLISLEALKIRLESTDMPDIGNPADALQETVLYKAYTTAYKTYSERISGIENILPSFDSEASLQAAFDMVTQHTLQIFRQHGHEQVYGNTEIWRKYWKSLQMKLDDHFIALLSHFAARKKIEALTKRNRHEREVVENMSRENHEKIDKLEQETARVTNQLAETTRLAEEREKVNIELMQKLTNEMKNAQDEYRQMYERQLQVQEEMIEEKRVERAKAWQEFQAQLEESRQRQEELQEQYANLERENARQLQLQLQLQLEPKKTWRIWDWLFPANFQARIEELRHSQEHIQAMNARNELEDSPNKTEQHHTQTNTAAAEINEQRPKMEEDKEEKTRNKQEEAWSRNIQRFEELSKIDAGRCYATKEFAAAEFDPDEGGVLKLKDRVDIKLVILPNALSSTQRVYIMLLPDHLDQGPRFSPVVECGPSGRPFKARIEELRHSKANNVQAMNARDELEHTAYETQHHHTLMSSPATIITEEQPKMEKDKKEKTREQQEAWLRNIERFNELTEIETGRCYATRVFAAGQFDAAIGGVLKLKDRDDIKLVILPNALEKTTQSIYMMLMSDPLDRGPSYSPVVECGPSGLKFKLPAELTLPHAAYIEDDDITDSDLAVRSRSKIGDQWSIDRKVKVLCYRKDTITLAVGHFTGSGLTMNLIKWWKGKKKVVGKNLDVAVFTDGTEFKVWVKSKDDREKDRIAHQEAARGYTLADWQAYLFLPNRGNLVVEKREFDARDPPEKFLTIGEEQVLELGHRFHCIRPDSLQETEFLFSSQHIQDDTEKLQIVARLDDGRHNQARFELVPHPEVAAPIQIEHEDNFEVQELRHPTEESVLYRSHDDDDDYDDGDDDEMINITINRPRDMSNSQVVNGTPISIVQNIQKDVQILPSVAMDSHHQKIPNVVNDEINIATGSTQDRALYQQRNEITGESASCFLEKKIDEINQASEQDIQGSLEQRVNLLDISDEDYRHQVSDDDLLDEEKADHNGNIC